jgi:hypothetical protein
MNWTKPASDVQAYVAPTPSQELRNSGYLGIVIDEGHRCIRGEGFAETMDLSRHPEFWKIAVTLIGRKGKVVETDVLTERHDDDSYVESSTLRSDVSKLNKKFKLLCLVARSIPRLGYKLEEISESTDKKRLAHT